MIEQVHIQNYKALRDVRLNLTPLHVLIGPNDSGKSSILEAVYALCRSVDMPLSDAFPGAWKGRELVWNRQPDAIVSLAATAIRVPEPFQYDLSLNFSPTDRSVLAVAEQLQMQGVPSKTTTLLESPSNQSRVAQVAAGSQSPPGVERSARMVHDAFSGVHSYRWNPRLLNDCA